MGDMTTVVWLSITVVTGLVAFLNYRWLGAHTPLWLAVLWGLCSGIAASGAFVVAQRLHEPVLAYLLAFAFGLQAFWIAFCAPLLFRLNERYLRQRRDEGTEPGPIADPPGE
jgi:hypothetical protein